LKKNELKQSEHVFIVGSTGTGKTVLANNYLSNTFAKVFVLDSKGTFSWMKNFSNKESLFVRNIKNLKVNSKKIHKIIYRPSANEMTQEYYNQFLKYVYNFKNCIVYIDEIAQICKNTFNYPLYAKHLLERGREFNIGVWGATQRPKNIFSGFMTESTHYFVFRINGENDRKRVAQDCSNDKFLERLTGHNFYYWRGDKEFEPSINIIDYKGK
jgi:hypothetical protein